MSDIPLSLAPYDVPEAITVIGNLLLSQGGQEALLRLLGDRGVTLSDLITIWQSQPKAEAPFLGDDDAKTTD